jgi:hypothetical protein
VLMFSIYLSIHALVVNVLLKSMLKWDLGILSRFPFANKKIHLRFMKDMIKARCQFV